MLTLVVLGSLFVAGGGPAAFAANHGSSTGSAPNTPALPTLPTGDFAVTINAPETSVAGESLTFDVQVTYTGVLPGLGLLTDTLPAAVTFVSAVPSGSVGPACLSVQQLVSGCPVNAKNHEVGHLAITVTTHRPGSATDVAAIVGVDLNLTNNLARAHVHIVAAPTPTPSTSPTPTPSETTPEPTSTSGETPVGGVQTGDGGTAGGFPVVPVSFGFGALLVAAATWVVRRRTL